MHTIEFLLERVLAILKASRTDDNFLRDQDLQLEVEVLLAHVLKVSRTHLYTWPNQIVSTNDQQRFFELMNRRITGEPIAYIIEQQEFWSLPLVVSSSVLIPRPETELLVEELLKKIPTEKKHEPKTVLDLGTGSGAIAIAIAKECPHWKIVATDISQDALKIAEKNVKNLSITNIQFFQGDWFSALDTLDHDQTVFDFVVSNPPYIAAEDPLIEKNCLRFEPKNALISAKDGFYDLEQIIKKAKKYLALKGYLIVEHSYAQGLWVAAMMRAEGYLSIATYKDLTDVNRVTVACNTCKT